MFGIPSKEDVEQMVFNAPRQFVEGLFSLISAPPKKAISIWNGLSQEDKKLFTQAALAAARLGAKALITADKGGKVEF